MRTRRVSGCRDRRTTIAVCFSELAYLNALQDNGRPAWRYMQALPSISQRRRSAAIVGGFRRGSACRYVCTGPRTPLRRQPARVCYHARARPSPLVDRRRLLYNNGSVVSAYPRPLYRSQTPCVSFIARSPATFRHEKRHS